MDIRLRKLKNKIDLKGYWIELTSTYLADIQLKENLWSQIEFNYTHSSRHYHNLDHLLYMFLKALQFKDQIQDFDTLSFSIFYHDFIYKATRSDNEEKSASEAEKRLVKLGVTPIKIRECMDQIKATKLHDDHSNIDTNYLVDFDLAILGEDSVTYNDYTQKIRNEYSVYPDFLYKRGRKKVLNHFLQMENIYKTPEFIKGYESKARENMMDELSRL